MVLRYDIDFLKEKIKVKVKYSIILFLLFLVIFIISIIFDLVVFASLWFFAKVRMPVLFQTVWFSYTIISNLVGMHIIRTSKKPFTQSNASKVVYASSIIICIVALIIPLTSLGAVIGLVPIPLKEIGIIFSTTFLYCIVATFAKKIYIRKYGEWI